MDISAGNEAQPRTHHWEIEYQYDNSISELYPTVVKRYVLRSTDRFLRDEIHIHSIKIAKKALPPELFTYQPFIYTNSQVFWGTNNDFYYIDKTGATRMLRRAPQN
jgi:hypothetical protein